MRGVAIFICGALIGFSVMAYKANKDLKRTVLAAANLLDLSYEYGCVSSTDIFGQVLPLSPETKLAINLACKENGASDLKKVKEFLLHEPTNN